MSVSAARRERVRWADTAKGVCILLVVLWHVVAKQYLRLDWPEGLRIPGAWGTLGELLLPLRMPLFFTISGMFALNAVNRSWRMSARPRVGKFLYLYVLWLLIHTAILSLTPEFPTDRATSPLGLLEQLTITPSNLWYLYALALYFVIAKLTRRFPQLLMLALAVALSIAAAGELIPVPGNRASLLQNLVFFLAGLYFRPFVERLAASANWPRLALATGVYGGVLLAMAATGTRDVPGVWQVACVAATAFGVLGAAMLARWDLLANPLTSIGRRTLPIYVIHMPLLALLDLFLARPLSSVGGPFQTVLAIVEPILMTAFLTWICLVLHRGIEALKLGKVLLDLPGGKDKPAARTTSPETPETPETPESREPVLAGAAAQPVATTGHPVWSPGHGGPQSHTPPAGPLSYQPAWSAAPGDAQLPKRPGRPAAHQPAYGTPQTHTPPESHPTHQPPRPSTHTQPERPTFAEPTWPPQPTHPQGHQHRQSSFDPQSTHGPAPSAPTQPDVRRHDPPRYYLHTEDTGQDPPQHGYPAAAHGHPAAPEPTAHAPYGEPASSSRREPQDWSWFEPSGPTPDAGSWSSGPAVPPDHYERRSVAPTRGDSDASTAEWSWPQEIDPSRPPYRGHPPHGGRP